MQRAEGKNVESSRRDVNGWDVFGILPFCVLHSAFAMFRPRSDAG
jgi:hypothetical protein